MAKRHMKGCSTTLIIRKIQIKTTMRSHFLPTRMPVIQMNNICWWGCGKFGRLVNCCWLCKMLELLWKHFFRRLSIELSHNPAILLSGIYPQHLYKNSNYSIIDSSRKEETTQMFIKIWHICTMGNNSAIKRNEVLWYVTKRMTSKT